MSTERVIVQRGVYKALEQAVVNLVKPLKSGDANEVKLGALFDERSAENVVNMLKEAKEAGADILLGDLNRDGAVVQPHVVAGVKPGMRMFENESFGPGRCTLSYVRRPLTSYVSSWPHGCRYC
jgi:acyl-CoA reductase-like NAD-dependent aldehyde dehydrogenase